MARRRSPLHPRRTQRVQGKREHERLRYRLDREWHAGVAGLIDMAVERGEADAEMLGMRIAEFGDVMGDLAGIVGSEILVARLQESQQRRRGGGPIAFVCERRRSHHVHGKFRSMTVWTSRELTPQR